MIAKNFDTRPAELLIQRHKNYSVPYECKFRGLNLVVYPNVFDPSLTKVSGLLADTIDAAEGDRVLDMFTGSGVLGLIAAQRASHVIGVDISQIAVACARNNAIRLNLCEKTEFRQGDLWEPIQSNEVFDLIIANPPLLPAIPENLLEKAIADSPSMDITTSFLKGCTRHLTKLGSVLMTISDACKISVGDPLQFVEEVAHGNGLKMSIEVERDVIYEKYRVLRFSSF